MAATLKLGDRKWATKEGSLLAYNDENNNYKPLPFDFTRASSATRVNKQGLIETVASGVPRIDFTDANGALLLEPQRTNLVTYSEDFSDNSWGNADVTVSSNAIISPDGGLNADEIIEGVGSAQHRVYKSISGLSAVETYTISVYVKKSVGERFVELNTTGIRIYFDLDNISVKTSHTGTGTIESVGNGWLKCSATGIIGLTSATIFFALCNTGLLASETYTGDGTSGVYIYGASLEQGSYATSYIPTEGSAVTKVKDSMNEQILGLTSIEQGTFFLDFDRGLTNGTARDGNNDGFFYRSGSSFPSTNAIEISTDIDGKVRAAIRIDGFLQLYTNDTLSRYKILFKWSGTSVNVFVNGVLEYTSTTRWTATLPLEYIGYSASFKKSVNQVLTFPTALTDSECIALTTI
jgi:hypothetical protein